MREGDIDSNMVTFIMFGIERMERVETLKLNIHIYTQSIYKHYTFVLFYFKIDN